jgi:hypothetical protein
MKLHRMSNQNYQNIAIKNAISMKKGAEAPCSSAVEALSES